MKRFSFFLTVLFLICVYASGSNIHEKAGTSAMPFLKIAIGAKGLGMGESQVAISDDLYSMHWNPAGFAKISGTQIGFMHNAWFEGINHEFVGLAQPLGNIGTIGLSAIYLSYGEITGRDAIGKETEVFQPYDLAYIFSYAQEIGGLAFGLNLKGVKEHIMKDASTNGFAFDLGAIYQLSDQKIWIGLNVQNIGGDLKFSESDQAKSFPLPRNVKLGIAYRVPNDTLTFTTDINRPADNDLSIGFGAALTVLKRLDLRGGFKHEFGGNDLGTISGLTSGFGLTLADFDLDYAFGIKGKFGSVHRVSLTASF